MLVIALRIFLVLILAFLFTSKGRAEINKWLDAEGIVHFCHCLYTPTNTRDSLPRT